MKGTPMDFKHLLSEYVKPYLANKFKIVYKTEFFKTAWSHENNIIGAYSINLKKYLPAVFFHFECDDDTWTVSCSKFIKNHMFQ